MTLFFLLMNCSFHSPWTLNDIVELRLEWASVALQQLLCETGVWGSGEV